MKIRRTLVAAAAAVLALTGAALAHDELPQELRDALPTLGDGSTPHSIGSEKDVHSPNMLLVGNTDDGGTTRMGTDLAFWGDLAVAGTYDFPGGFRLVSIADPTSPQVVGRFPCKGPQSDVSIWRNLVFVSVDSPMNKPECDGAATLGQTNPQVLNGQAYEGIRIVSISDRSNPQQIAFVDTECGSHTHTLVPDEARNRVLIYVLSYPLGGQSVDCNGLTHRKISVVEVPLGNPAAAHVVSTPDVSPAIGCHDVTVFMPGKLAGAACISESQLWDISDPVNPRVVSHIANPAINIHHSTTFSNDGNTLAIGDELGGAAASPGCADGDEHVPLGAIWFYDVSNPALPVPKGTFSIPQRETTIGCTAHNFNTVPLKTDRDVLVSGWYNGGVTAVDFTDPSDAEQLGFYTAKEPVIANVWSGYWYRGFIYGNNFDEAIDTSNPNGRSRGFDTFVLADKGLKRDAVKLQRLNPQTMEAFK